MNTAILIIVGVALWLGATFLGLRWVLRRTAAEICSRDSVVGRASWYGESFRGKSMANGQPFDPEAMTCASLLWPMGSLLRVQCVQSGAAVVVEVTDRGPAAWTSCILDLSSRAFRRIADPKLGRTLVRVSVLREGAEKP